MDLQQIISDFKESPFRNLYLITVVLAIEVFALGVTCPSLFMFHVSTPFGVYESWFLALIYSCIWYFWGWFINK
ncbi:hypothetical protein VRK_19660 [Vibrio sp. MEBiC08052]|nr:hypothetical protein VRK_19660 [Vibrio sp. MEBiC08052]